MQLRVGDLGFERLTHRMGKGLDLNQDGMDERMDQDLGIIVHYSTIFTPIIVGAY